MERKPKRRTRERILETALKLFNDFGEPNVTTTVIADEMEISPGNLYYHFHSKDEIVNALFAEFEREIEETLAAPARRAPNVEDMWLFLHLLFEAIWKYRFLYRDLDDLLSRNRLLEVHFKQILAHKVKTAAALCEGLVATGEMQASRGELQALATRPGVVKSRNALMDAAYDDQVYVDDRTIDSHIKRLRKKFKVTDDDFDMIETLYGVGYRFKEA